MTVIWHSNSCMKQNVHNNLYGQQHQTAVMFYTQLHYTIACNSVISGTPIKLSLQSSLSCSQFPQITISICWQAVKTVKSSCNSLWHGKSCHLPDWRSTFQMSCPRQHLSRDIPHASRRQLFNTINNSTYLLNAHLAKTRKTVHYEYPKLYSKVR